MILVNDLKDKLNEDSLKIIDSRPKEDYESGHIGGALNIGPGEFDDESSSKLAPRDKFESLMEANGINNDDYILVYSDFENIQKATRILWAFKAYGHDKADILEGHYESWEDSNYEIEKGPAKIDENSNYKAIKVDESIIADKDEIQDIIEKNQNITIIDCRQEEEYKSKEPANEENARGGYIPGAINIPHGLLLKEDGTYKDKEDLGKIFNGKDLGESSQIITYCQSGYRASVCWYALTHILDYNNVKIYDGSMVEWANNEDLPLAFVE